MKDWLIDNEAKTEIWGNERCMEDMADLRASLSRILNAMLKKNLSTLNDFDKTVTIQVIDSNGGYNGGFLKGRKVFAGRFDECRGIKYNGADRSNVWEGDMFRFYFGKQKDSICASGSILFAFDQCLPKSCKVNEIRKLLEIKEHKDICLVVNNDFAKTYNKNNWLSWFLGILMIAIFVVSVISGIIDYFLADHIEGTQIKDLLWYRLFIAFSLSSNVKGILNTKGTNKPGQIGPLHCMRFLSMVWVIMGHTNENLISLTSNPLDILEISKKAQFYLLSNTFFAVDTFFFIGGLLLAYIWFKEFKKNRRLALSLNGWLMFYIHRILRLSPPYYLAFFFWGYIFIPNMPESANRLFSGGGGNDPCRSFWWPAMLYVQNLVHPQHQCYGVTWYLAADMQMFVFSPILLVTLAMNLRLGLIIAGSILFLSTSGNIATVYHFHYPQGPHVFDLPDPKESNGVNYMWLMYTSPWIRCQIYVIGLLIGYLLQYKKHLKINKWLNLCLLLASMAFMLFDVMVLHLTPHDKVMPIFWRAIYSAFSKPLWGLCLSLIVISCYYGYGGLINSFMSWPGWAPLGRLTYSAYLIHYMVIYYLITIHPSEIIWGDYFDIFTSFAIPAILLTYFLSLFWSSCFEVAMGKVESILIGGRRKPEAKNVEINQNGKKIETPNDHEKPQSTIVSMEKD
ncbi:unnamed protein product, partial [Mesorhabditis belari]|uniref:Nose resistant-to-fluoxetine protein N-terminal domain-containing protein n=1 Tax=Mesorhabditis belari TaxID=2138241 RepID=A0AAF3FKH4_9BILA